ncbi:Major facilitator superfamily domain general substrate transporter [Penicillium sp. DV-2018c]|nr:Major facilitator superfamily domain general substrate transporter [Penicillium sp. DV-2018c]
MGIKQFIKSRSGLRVDNRATTSAATLTLRQSLWPLSLVTILFFLWGFAYGLLDTLNSHFQNTLHITRGRSAGLQAAYFGAYPLASLGYANWILRHFGYKAVFIFGLCLYGIGALCMWPAGLHQSFGGFCGATFVIGSGLGSLETAANPYLTESTSPRPSMPSAQSSAPSWGSYVFFTETQDDVSALQRVQWVYLAIGIFVFCLAFVFFISNIPEVTDEDMAFQVAQTHVDEQDKPFWKQYKLFHATLAQFTYTGAQVAIAGYFINYIKDTWPGTPNSTSAKYLAGAQGAFAVGRFLGSGIMKYVRARWVFLVYLSCTVAFLAASVTQRNQNGLAMLVLTLFFESVCFPTIMALGIRGLGRHYKRGSGFIVGGVCGGAVVPPILGHVADMRNNTGFAFIVPTMFMVVAWTYAVAVNFVPAYVITVDKVGTSTVGLENHVEDEEACSETTYVEEKNLEATHVE